VPTTYAISYALQFFEILGQASIGDLGSTEQRLSASFEVYACPRLIHGSANSILLSHA
jgi:hypothetical protein